MHKPMAILLHSGIYFIVAMPIACSQRTSRPAAAARTETLNLTPDRTLTTEEYIRRGMPSPDKAWTSDDMAKALVILQAIAKQDPEKLPRYGSNRSGEVFARMVSPANLTDLRQTPIDQRLPPVLEYLNSSNGIMKTYHAAFQRKAVGGGDLVELFGMLLRTAVVVVAEINEFVPTLKKDDPTYLTRMAGLDKMRRGLAGLVVGSLQTLTERDAYQPADLLRLVGHMQDTVPVLIGELPQGMRNDLSAQLGKLVADPKQSDVRAELEKLQSKVSLASQKAERTEGERQGLKAEDLQKRGMVMHRSQAGEPDESGWCLATSTGGGFSVRLPGRFNDFTSSAKAEDGVVVTLHALGMVTLVEAKFSAVALSRSDGKLKSESPADDMVASLKKDGTPVEKRAIKIAGHSGAELKVTGRNTVALIRMVIVKQTLYQMIVEYPTALPAEGMAKDAKRFYESFSLDEPASK